MSLMLVNVVFDKVYKMILKVLILKVIF